MSILASILGVFGILLGLYILVTRMGLLQAGRYAWDYVCFWFFVGSGCMVGGVFVLDCGAVSYVYLAHLGAALSLLSYQRQVGTPWTPPHHAKTEPSLFDEVSDD